MHPIEYFAPRSIEEAVDLFQRYGSDARPLAGGTDLIVQMKTGRRKNPVVVDIKKISELTAISWEPTKGLTLGAATPCYQIYRDADVRAHYRGLIDVVEMIGGTPIQGRASVGGNLCNASPSADSTPILIAYRVICHIVGPHGVRHLPVEEFCAAPGVNALAPGEFLASLHFPPPSPRSGARYLRFIPRNEMDIAVVGAGVHVELENGSFRSARIALGAVAPTPLLVKEAGDALADEPVNEESIRIASGLAKAAARPISDMRGPDRYRRHLCEVLTRRALEGAVKRARKET